MKLSQWLAAIMHNKAYRYMYTTFTLKANMHKHLAAWTAFKPKRGSGLTCNESGVMPFARIFTPPRSWSQRSDAGTFRDQSGPGGLSKVACNMDAPPMQLTSGTLGIKGCASATSPRHKRATTAGTACEATMQTAMPQPCLQQGIEARCAGSGHPQAALRTSP